MQLKLSRIEREYVLRHMEDILPPLSIVCDKILFTISEKKYTIGNLRIFIYGDFAGLICGKKITVFFQHKRRGMFFFSHVVSANDVALELLLAPDFFMEDLSRLPSDKSNIKINLQKCSSEIFASSIYPLDSILVNPEICLAKKDVFANIAKEIGINENESLLLYRLYEFLEGFRSEANDINSKADTESLFFIDHKYFLVSVLNFDKTAYLEGNEVNAILLYEKRLITIKNTLAGFLQINKKLSVLFYRIIGIQEEDKRFLYEKLYKTKYLGS